MDELLQKHHGALGMTAKSDFVKRMRQRSIHAKSVKATVTLEGVVKEWGQVTADRAPGSIEGSMCF